MDKTTLIKQIIHERKYNNKRSLMELFNYKPYIEHKFDQSDSEFIEKINIAIEGNKNVMQCINDYIRSKQTKSFIEFNMLDVLKLKYLELMIEHKKTNKMLFVLKFLYYEDKIVDDIAKSVLDEYRSIRKEQPNHRPSYDPQQQQKDHHTSHETHDF